ncbi:GH92 family glycosyl hydrolase [Mucilaginibacter flavus]|uniref:GH92 family glycosyl hydrolase n=1 Tax=Mucilaginibacter flavus TaxID=931504 RepID=UPI0025B458FE|nr:GH92 family glycosyl hydrolase [Mucilaginibacter flavus]MDN3580735.1 GH92 family glycosyl hydrolase [Mucilaginibacter flavus]
MQKTKEGVVLGLKQPKMIVVLKIRNYIAGIMTMLSLQPALAQNLVKYVQPMAGTAAATTSSALKHGLVADTRFANTIPAVTAPFAMTQWTPQTESDETKCVPPYYYKDNMFTGLRGSHWLSGSCTQDYGSFTIMPITGRLKTSNYGAQFNHNEEFSSPYLYQLKMQKYQVNAAVTSTARCAMMQFTVDKADSLYLLITPNSDYHEGFVKVDNKTGEVYGYNPAHRIYQGWGKSAGFSGFFVIRFERSLDNRGTFAGDKIFNADSIKNGSLIGAYVGFKMDKGEKLTIRIGTSFTSLEGARKNLDAEMPGFNFEQTVAINKAVWEKALGQVRVTTGSEQDKRVFYTALYHTMQQPRLFNDVDGRYPRFAGNYQTEILDKGNYYDDFSMWDIYRAEIPLFEILNPPLVNNLAKSLILKGKQGGWMPIFPCWNSYTSEMIGDHTTSVISSAYLKGITNFDANEAYQLLRHNAFELPVNRADYVEGKGRRALDSYLKYKYIPLEDSVSDAFHKMEQVSRTIEYAYDDYALAQFAKSLKKYSDYTTLTKRAKYYANVFDASAGFMRGKHADGSWISNFDPDKKATYITEGTPRQYTFYVPHDVTGLVKLMGGADKLEHALDSLFIKGEYWHGNEPGHQIPFMYNYSPSPWKTQADVRNILAAEYSDGPGGLGGNDDAGQMSAWYVFASLGFYPVNPVSGEYLLCSPLFDKAVINLQNNSKFEITCHKSGPKSMYIHQVKLNGKTMPNNFIRYNHIMAGGKLEIYLQDKPDHLWANKPIYQPKGM